MLVNESDIVKRVLGFLQNDRRSLCSVCRAGRSLAEPASSILYHTISINKISNIEPPELEEESVKEVGNTMEWGPSFSDLCSSP